MLVTHHRWTEEALQNAGQLILLKEAHPETLEHRTIFQTRMPLVRIQL